MKTTIALAFAMAALLAYVGPQIDDHSGESAAAKQAAQERLAKAAQKICGINAAWEIKGDVLQCLTHRGFKTVLTKVTP